MPAIVIGSVEPESSPPDEVGPVDEPPAAIVPAAIVPVAIVPAAVVPTLPAAVDAAAWLAPDVVLGVDEFAPPPLQADKAVQTRINATHFELKTYMSRGFLCELRRPPSALQRYVCEFRHGN